MLTKYYTKGVDKGVHFTPVLDCSDNKAIVTKFPFQWTDTGM